ncbi:hypothetical protein YB2330_003115 [Saitoella coloradoensis]
MSTSTAAEALKAQGNEYYKNGQYEEAHKMYTQAIIKDPTNPVFFANRAICRIKMILDEEAVADCERATTLSPTNIKGWYYMGQALLKLRRPNEALKACQKAYDLAKRQSSPLAVDIVEKLLAAKKARWDAMEQRRVDQECELLANLKLHLSQDRDRRIAECMAGDLPPEEKDAECDWARQECEEQTRALCDTFARANESLRPREVPSQFIDPISFNFFTDPVITPSGHTYERATLMQHLKTSPTDPLSRKKLWPEQLIPNIALRDACTEFLEKNGWAVDY